MSLHLYGFLDLKGDFYECFALKNGAHTVFLWVLRFSPCFVQNLRFLVSSDVYHM